LSFPGCVSGLVCVRCGRRRARGLDGPCATCGPEGVLEIEFDLKKGSAFMEYVWKVADGLASAFGLICLFLAGFLIVITIIVATLRRRHE